LYVRKSRSTSVTLLPAIPYQSCVAIREFLLSYWSQLDRHVAAGDDEALAIMRRQGSEVTRLAIAALHQLEMEDSPVQVVLGGSVLASSRSILLDSIAAGIRAEAPKAQTSLCTTRPVVGAGLAGLELAGAEGAAEVQLRAWLDEGSAEGIG